jgi:hypothetical protein
MENRVTCQTGGKAPGQTPPESPARVLVMCRGQSLRAAAQKRGMSSSRALVPKVPVSAYNVAAGYDPLEEPPV